MNCKDFDVRSLSSIDAEDSSVTCMHGRYKHTCYLRYANGMRELTVFNRYLIRHVENVKL